MKWDSNPRPKTAGTNSLRQRLRPLGHPSLDVLRIVATYMYRITMTRLQHSTDTPFHCALTFIDPISERCQRPRIILNEACFDIALPVYIVGIDA